MQQFLTGTGYGSPAAGVRRIKNRFPYKQMPAGKAILPNAEVGRAANARKNRSNIPNVPGFAHEDYLEAKTSRKL